MSKSQDDTPCPGCDVRHTPRKKVIHMMHITPPFHAQVIHMTCITIPFVRYVRFVPLNLSHPPVILTSIKKVKKVLTKKGIQMNSLHENRNSLESYSQIRERLADSICDECEYACFVHKENCSRKVVK
jgi:hypothetical protein